MSVNWTQGIPKDSEQSLPTISVIIPVYNVEKYLTRCVRSVLNNTYQNLQVICVDDGSRDNCGMILDELAVNDPRLVVIHQENQGVAAARNRGLELAEGELVAFIDSDDYIHPLYFETMLHCMLNRKADLVVCGYRSFYEEEEIGVPKFERISYSRINGKEFFAHYCARHMIWGRLYHRSDLDGIRFTADVRMADDTLYNLRVIARLKDPVVYETSAELYYYLLRKDSIVHTGQAERMIDIGNWYMANKDSETGSSGDWRWMLEMETIKAALSYRHTVRFVRRDDRQVLHANQILNNVFKELRSFRKQSLAEYAILYAMIRFPHLYRLFRILQDPSMLTWERNNQSDRADRPDY